jgi:hypothetical protein
VAKHIVETMAPGLVRVSAYVYALGKFEFSSLRILHVEIDVENEVADLLDGTPRGPIRANPVRNVALTSIAVLDPGPRSDLLLQCGWNGGEAKAPRGAERLLEQDIEHLQAGHLDGLGRFQRSIDQDKAEKRHAGRIIGVRGHACECRDNDSGEIGCIPLSRRGGHRARTGSAWEATRVPP